MIKPRHKKFSIDFPMEDHRELQDVVKELGLTRSIVVRQAVKKYVMNHKRNRKAVEA